MSDNLLTRRETIGGLVAGSFGVATVDVSRATAENDDAQRYVIGTTSDTAERDISSRSIAVHRTLDFGSRGGATVGYFDDEQLDRLEKRDDVRYIERDYTRRAYEPVTVNRSEDSTATPSDDRIARQDVPWGVERVRADDPPDKAAADRSARIAILDSGVDPAHESLEVADGHAPIECTFGDCETEWADESGHGTHCGGTAAALDNDVGVVGVNPEAELYAVKVMGSDGSGTDSDIAAGIEWCADNDVDVINMSLGGPEPGPVLEDAVQYAYERGVLVIAAAGNAGPDNPAIDYPAKYEQCIAVAATDSRDEIPRWSSRGEAVELAAPGADIRSTVPDDEYDSMSGTSMSAPHVAGLAARLMSHGIPSAEDTETADDPGGVRGILRETATDLGFGDDEQGHGLIDAAAAYEEIAPLRTDGVSHVRATSARFAAELRTLDGAEAAEAFFQWREADESGWTETDRETLSESGEFTADVDDLDPDTEYEVQAVVESEDGGEDGDVVSFATGLDDVVVETVDAVADDHTSLACTGDLLGIENADGADVAFEWRRPGESEWDETEPQSVSGIGEFGDEVTGLDAETEYEIRATVDVDGTTDTGDALSAETEPEPGVPEIDSFDITDDSNRHSVRARVDWTVSDPDGDLREVASELRYAGEDEPLHAVSTDLEGETESGVHTLRNGDRLEGAGETYEIRLRVTDGEGQETDVREEITLDEPSPPPSVDQLEITPADFLGRPRTDVEWAVSDEGGELWELELELRYADGDEVLDDATPMARGEEASGSDSLTDDDESAMGDEYEVTITVADYFDQRTEETTRVTIDE